MELLLKRIFTCDTYTIGHLYVNDLYVCDTLEDIDRMLDDSMTVEQIQKIKVKDKTAIPTGQYNIQMGVVSPKYSKVKYYMNLCQGKVPRLAKVKGYEGVLIHVGNTHTDTSGCILVGRNTVKGKVTDSKATFSNLYNILKNAVNKGESINLVINRTY